MEITGGCLCGAVRYRVTAEPITTRACWCRLCQYVGAGSGTVNVAFPAAAVAISGTLSDYRSVADSGSVMHRCFCPVCGTPVTSAAESRPHAVFVRAGTLDDPEIAAPTMTVWIDAAPSWACIDVELPAVEGQPVPIPPPSAS